MAVRIILSSSEMMRASVIVVAVVVIGLIKLKILRTNSFKNYTVLIKLFVFKREIIDSATKLIKYILHV
jgi:hypothetical protein